MGEMHEATFTWPVGPAKVIVTGTFDNWAASMELTRTDTGFSKSFGVPWDTKVAYKFIVDGEWKASPTAPQEYDAQGNLNNTYISPPKPVVSGPPAPVEEKEEPKSTANEVKDSALATTGAPTVFSYITSGVGAAIATVTGIDPINPQHIPVEETATPAASAPAPAKTEPIPIADEPVVLNLPSEAPKKSEEAKAVPIPDVPEPLMEPNTTLPAEVESPVAESTSASHPTEATATTTTTAVDSAAKDSSTTPSKKEETGSPRTSNVSPPTTPSRKFTLPRSRPSMSGSVSESVEDSSGKSPKKKKRDSFFGKVKGVFSSPKKEKTSA